MKRIISIFLTLLIFSALLFPTAHATEPYATAEISIAKAIVNSGSVLEFYGYNIDGANYLKLRDLAYALRNTDQGFEVIWNESAGSIELIPETAYTPVGGEMAKTDQWAVETQKTNHSVYCNGKALNLTAYTINGNNYFKLREILSIFDIQVSWDGAAGIIYIDSYHQKEVTVSTAEEFANAIASNTVIHLNPGTYDLTPFNDRFPNGFTISNITSLTIIGAGADKTEFTNSDRFAEILLFQNCRNISVSGVKAGHTPQKYECDAGVFKLDRCLNVTVDNCYLYGCGSIGVSINESAEVSVNNTTITDCSLRAVSVDDSLNVIFDNCKITKNRAYAAVITVYSHYRLSEVTFNQCDISDNVNILWSLIETLEVYDSSRIILLFTECTIAGNIHTAETDSYLFDIDGGAVALNKCVIKNNELSYEHSYSAPFYVNCEFSGNTFPIN